jgi:hypothetical protein
MAAYKLSEYYNYMAINAGSMREAMIYPTPAASLAHSEDLIDLI